MFRNNKVNEGRRFGRDITNCPLPDQKLRKINWNQHKTLPTPTAMLNTYQPLQDPIFDHQQEIVQYMHKAEYHVREEISRDRNDVTDKMRQILIDWLVDVHQSFQLKEETLHLAVLYLEEFQSQRIISKENYQLVGITCLWIASKYQEIYPPALKKYVEVTAFTYTASEIKAMEGEILNTLNFNLTKITPLALLRAHQHELPHLKALNLAKYLLELYFLNKRLLSKQNIRLCVAAAVRLAKSIYGSPSIGLELTHGLSEADLHCSYKQMCILMKLKNKYDLTAIKRKFSNEQYLGVGLITLEL